MAGTLNENQILENQIMIVMRGHPLGRECRGIAKPFWISNSTYILLNRRLYVV
jgi:hypothetical protein